MIDTPMADAAAQRCIDTTSKWHGEWVPLEVARQLEHKLAEATGENTRLRAALASSKDPCAYCQLPKDEMSKCRSGFPGCARADDLMGCPELGAALEVDRLERELASVTKGLLELEEERDELDRELQDADRRANSLMRELTEAKIGAARYEYVRKLNPRQFSDLVMFCNTPGIRFDAEVDRRRNQS